MPLQRVGDLEVHYREHGQGAPLVLIPGNWTTSLWWRPTMELLPAGLRALAYDVRGRGHTRGPALHALHDDRDSFAVALRGIAPGAPDDALWKQLLDEGHLQRREASLATLQAFVDWAPGERLEALHPLPSLVVSGEKDVLSTLEMGQRCASLLGARHVVMKGVGHSPNLEAPRDFLALWQDFLEPYLG